MGIQDFFRLRNLFNNESQEESVLPSFSTFGSSDYGSDYGSDDSSNDTPAMSSFLDSVMNPPSRTRPSGLRMAGTGLLSLLQGSTDPASEKKGFWGSLANKPFNIDQTSSILQMPNEQRIDDWKLRTGALEKAASIESQLPGRRALAEQRIANANVIPQRENRLSREGQTRLEHGADRIEISRAKQSLDEWKAKNPNGKVYAPKGGNVVLINPLTGEPTDTGIPTGSLTDEDRIKLLGQQRLEQISATGDERRETQQMIGDQRLEQIGASGDESRKTKQTIPGKNISSSVTDKPISPTQQKVQYQLKANQAIQERPEWSEFISINPNSGMVEIEPPSKTWLGRQTGPSKEQYDEMVSYISGRNAKSVSNEITNPVTKPVTKPAAKSSTLAKPESSKTLTRQVRNKNTGEVKVQISTDGGKTWSFK